jgi:hypothetical protein
VWTCKVLRDKKGEGNEATRNRRCKVAQDYKATAADSCSSAFWVSMASTTWIEGERGMSSPSMVAADGEWPPLPRGRTEDWVRGALAQRSLLDIRKTVRQLVRLNTLKTHPYDTRRPEYGSRFLTASIALMALATLVKLMNAVQESAIVYLHTSCTHQHPSPSKS